MNRRSFLKTAALTGLTTAISGCSFPMAAGDKTAARSRKPMNVVWISCEDISPRLGCYGDTVAQTPNLDSLAKEGMRFDGVFTTSPVCAPVRSGIITGMYPTTMGTHHMRTRDEGSTKEVAGGYRTVPPTYVKAFTEYLRAAGYYCTNDSKTDYQFSDPYVPISIWDECGEGSHYDHRLQPDQPFFAVFNDTITHESKCWDEPEMTDPNTVDVPPYYPDTPKVRGSIARLYDRIYTMDQKAGQIMDDLKKKGLWENTIVFFWGDHGDGLPRCKRWPYDSGTRIPLLIKAPGLKPGSVNKDLISSIDFGPTVLSLVGLDVPVHMQGRAFLGEKKAAQREYVFSHRDRFDDSYDMIRAVRDKRYRYVRNYYPNQPYVLWVPFRNNSPIMQEMFRLQAEGRLTGIPAQWFSDTRHAEEFYDCQADPHNICNLADDPRYQDELKRMSKVLDEWRLETGDLGGIPESQLKERFWPGGVQPKTSRPWFIPNASSNRGARHIEGETAEFEYPAMISFYCATEGASMVYTTQEGENPRWKLATGPLRLKRGRTLLRSRAIRYGYEESEEGRCTITVR
jgi:arylsulfatase A-like enzyme